MDLFKDILENLLARQDIHVTFPGLSCDPAEIAEMTALDALQKIKAIIEDDSLSDFECIEQIVCVFESVGSGAGNRHDFG